ncbi:E3 ubiquitin-protein ligase HERC2-like [Ctenocephalides felis]|uniref:E3 ubiquitin-protein ligase HERC2-like n=1 Tax=Ctenocephalides felis TaxID=7515 RepID=UPI000E6E4B55|nr:E3 ubiquitin-protein ligase HERC2-like [Ctenocephalides felis]
MNLSNVQPSTSGSSLIPDGFSEASSSVMGTNRKYSKRSHFLSADEYALYVQELIHRGMLVRSCQAYDEVKPGDLGLVSKVSVEGLHDLSVEVKWYNQGFSNWVPFIFLELVADAKSSAAKAAAAEFIDRYGVRSGGGALGRELKVGDRVRVRMSVVTPRYKWGCVDHSSVGVITQITRETGDVTVNFREQSNWAGQLSEMELVPPSSDTKSRRRTIDLLAESESNTGTAVAGQILEEWSECVRSLAVSSGESLKNKLLDDTTAYWQSNSSTSGNHFIRLEIVEYVVVHKLFMTVNPQDLNYMPYTIVVRGGDNFVSMAKLNYLTTRSNDSRIVLLSDVQAYYRCIEIYIKQVRGGGIDCRVQNIKFLGKRLKRLQDPSTSASAAALAGIENGDQMDTVPMNNEFQFMATDYNDSFCEDLNFVAGSNGAGGMNGDGVDYGSDGNQVLVWGLNDKDQLGGLKGSKVKLPVLSGYLTALKPIYIVGGSKSLFVISQHGKLYACGEGTNGRLGMGHTNNVCQPRPVPFLAQHVIRKVAVHSGGKHAMALTLDGKVFSWGEGEDGKLGHGNRLTLEKPRLIESLKNKRIRDIACGSSHSAAITSSGELYTWGLGEYGRLGHGDNCTQVKPKLVKALSGHRVVQIACGSRDAQTLCLTDQGLVFSWGDGDFGKLGRGGSEGCSVPKCVERLTGLGVRRLECGAQFSLALTDKGEVWTWGKGDYYRLGHGTDQHVRRPTLVQALKGKRVIDVAVGALHCLAVTDTGELQQT